MVVRYLSSNELYHHGVKGMKWGVRRYQNPDGTLTDEGRKRFKNEKHLNKEATKQRVSAQKYKADRKRQMADYNRANYAFNDALKEINDSYDKKYGSDKRIFYGDDYDNYSNGTAPSKDDIRRSKEYITNIQKAYRSTTLKSFTETWSKTHDLIEYDELMDAYKSNALFNMNEAQYKDMLDSLDKTSKRLGYSKK